MAEIKRGYRVGDSEVISESRMLEGVSWASWRQILVNHLKEKKLVMPEGAKEQILHDWFVLRHLRKLHKIKPYEYDEQKEEIFKRTERTVGIFGDPSMVFAITFITTKTELVKS